MGMEGREGGGEKKKTHTHALDGGQLLLIEKSHTGRLAAAPEAGAFSSSAPPPFFLHLKRRPLLFLGRDLMEEPQRE